MAPRNTIPGILGEGLMQADTVVRRAGNSLTMDGADALEAAVVASLGYGRPEPWTERFASQRRAQDARDAYDLRHRPAAVAAGEALGLGLGFGVGAGPVGAGAVKYVTQLPTRPKGDLGEAFSIVKTLASGDLPIVFRKKYLLPNGRTPEPDHQTLRGVVVESKYRTGRHEPLRGAQADLQKFVDPKFRHDKWGPGDVRRGTASVTAGGLLGGRIADERRGQ